VEVPLLETGRPAAMRAVGGARLQMDKLLVLYFVANSVVDGCVLHKRHVISNSDCDEWSDQSAMEENEERASESEATEHDEEPDNTKVNELVEHRYRVRGRYYRVRGVIKRWDGKRFAKCCGVTGCRKLAQGPTTLCKSHGGGARCRFPSCSDAARSCTKFCIQHEKPENRKKRKIAELEIPDVEKRLKQM